MARVSAVRFRVAPRSLPAHPPILACPSTLSGSCSGGQNLPVKGKGNERCSGMWRMSACASRQLTRRNTTATSSHLPPLTHTAFSSVRFPRRQGDPPRWVSCIASKFGSTSVKSAQAIPDNSDEKPTLTPQPCLPASPFGKAANGSIDWLVDKVIMCDRPSSFAKGMDTRDLVKPNRLQ
jgi:hypothetical protein